MLQVPEPARQLEHHEMAHHVGLHVDIGIDHRMADAGLGRQVHDPVEVAVPAGQRQHCLAVGDVGFQKGKALILAQGFQAGELQDRVVVVAEIVDTHHSLAPGQQGPRDVRPDEAGDSGDENRHAAGDYNISFPGDTVKRRA